ARARSSPATRMINQDEPNKQYAATAQRPTNSENQMYPGSEWYDTTTCAKSRPCENAVMSEPMPKLVTQRLCSSFGARKRISKAAERNRTPNPNRHNGR